MVFMQEPLSAPMLACLAQFLRELWRSRCGEYDALAVGGAEGLQHAWAVGAAFHGGWRDATGPAHILKLEIERAGAVMSVPLHVGVGGQILVCADAGPALVMQHMKTALLARRQEALAERVNSIDIVPASAAAAPSCRSRMEHAAFARALVTGALWTRGRLVE